MDGYYLESLRNLALLDMILRNKQQIKKQPWDKECKVFIGGLKYNVCRIVGLQESQGGLVL